jgi:hypothetical protein
VFESERCDGGAEMCFSGETVDAVQHRRIRILHIYDAGEHQKIKCKGRHFRRDA